MQESNFDVWSPVDDNNILSRLFWIIGSLISLSLLIVSLCVESAVLSILDVVLPTGIILYGIIKCKKFPIYYYTTCLSGLYPIIWLIIISPYDFYEENIEYNSSVIVSSSIIFVAFAVLLFLFILGVSPRGTNKGMVSKLSVIFKLDKFISILAALTVLGSLILNLNVICDKPYKTEWVYLQDIIYVRHDVDVFYTKYNSDIQYEIDAKHNKSVYTYDWRKDWLYVDENGNEIFQIEYGKGALGMPWRHIVGNK